MANQKNITSFFKTLTTSIGEKRQNGLPSSDNKPNETLGDFETPASKKSKLSLTSNRQRKRLVINDSDGDENELSPNDSALLSTPISVKSTNNYKRKANTPLSATQVNSTGNNDSFGSTGSLTPLTPASIERRRSSKLSQYVADESPSISQTESVECDIQLKHLTFDFLKLENRRDANGKHLDHPDFDNRSLFVPESFLKKQTPGHQQWWKIKSAHFDTIILFKVGKFYELYHMDAVIAVEELGLRYMAGDFAHSGFPEIAYGRFSSQLIDRGYKVARVEQCETPQMLQERCKGASGGAKDKVVKRELCNITTPGTRLFSYLDGVSDSISHPPYLMAICERAWQFGESEAEISVGVCFVDTRVGKFTVGQFIDDSQYSRLRTLLVHQTPAQILLERHCFSKNMQDILRSGFSSTMIEYLLPEKQFWKSQRAIRYLNECGCFQTVDDKKSTAGLLDWPEALKLMLINGDNNLGIRNEFELAWSCLGACIWYLSECLIDIELLTMKNFSVYYPQDLCKIDDTNAASFSHQRSSMIIDGVALRHVDIVCDTSESKCDSIDDISLLSQINHCITAFGKRLLSCWIRSPLFSSNEIVKRQRAVSNLINNPECLDEISMYLKKIPDMEILLQKIHTLSRNRYPDSNAVMYESDTYSKRKIVDFISALDGLQAAVEIQEVLKMKFECKELDSDLLLQLSSFGEKNVIDSLDYFRNAFDPEKAKREGRIVPEKGKDDEVDASCDRLDSIHRRFEHYLKEQRRKFACDQIDYCKTKIAKYQLEIPDNIANKITNTYNLCSQIKGFKRYITSDLEQLIAELADAESQQQISLNDAMRRLFDNFDKRRSIWETVVSCIAMIDVLCSFARYSMLSEMNMCLPELVTLTSADQLPFLEIVNGYHPCVSRICTIGDEFIPNDIRIGINEDGHPSSDSAFLITGANMSGKTTLMKTVSSIVVLAQMGSFVPALRCRLSPCDRLFVRLGASDRLLAGYSTFMVECVETKTILDYAKKDSIVILDELGRGTSTSDAVGIAAAVLSELIERKCRLFFSTHFHLLLDLFNNHKSVKSFHMSFQVENESIDDPSEENVTLRTSLFLVLVQNLLASMQLNWQECHWKL